MHNIQRKRDPETQTYAEAFDEIYKLACELYRYAESFHPLIKREKLPLEAFMKGAGNTLPHNPRQHPSHHKPQPKPNSNTYR
jgi:hypothetical protein